VYELLRAVDPGEVERAYRQRVEAGDRARAQNNRTQAGQEYFEAWRLRPTEAGVGFRAAADLVAVEDYTRASRVLTGLALSSDAKVAEQARQFLDRLKPTLEARARQGPGVPGQPRVITGQDGAEMVLVPAGEFARGSTPQEVSAARGQCKAQGLKAETCDGWFGGESPRRQVWLDAFYIDRYEVTNAQFERFVTTAEHRTTAEKEGSGRVLVQRDGLRF
jgi:formylglycine-generating enzyme required for sulfatase activity